MSTTYHIFRHENVHSDGFNNLGDTKTGMEVSLLLSGDFIVKLPWKSFKFTESREIF
jgi:hypothetical protein